MACREAERLSTHPEELGVKCKIEGELKELGEEGRYDCVYTFTL